MYRIVSIKVPFASQSLPMPSVRAWPLDLLYGYRAAAPQKVTQIMQSMILSESLRAGRAIRVGCLLNLVHGILDQLWHQFFGLLHQMVGYTAYAHATRPGCTARTVVSSRL